eukprot:4420525-Prorocentrum_lima.AAC.1
MMQMTSKVQKKRIVRERTKGQMAKLAAPKILPLYSMPPQHLRITGPINGDGDGDDSSAVLFLALLMMLL